MSHRFAPWDRYVAIRQLHERGAQWVLTIEADSLFMNASMRIEDIIERHGQGKDLLASGDLNDHYLAGNVLMRNTLWVRNAICSAWKVCPSPGFDQLGAMMVVLGGGKPEDPSTWQAAYDMVWGKGITAKEQAAALSNLPKATQEHLALLPQRVMNSYDGELHDDAEYQHGDWLIHFAGSPSKDAQVSEYAGNVIFASTNSQEINDCSAETFGFHSFCK